MVTQEAAVETYFASMPERMREALLDLRKTIRAAAPEATEVMSYGVPTFKYQGSLVSMGAAKNHCAFYVMSPAVMEAHSEELKAYDTSKGTIRFSPDDPLPDELVTKLVKARIAQNESKKSK
jgi:uncharacterized protein YdhG (YjbR/CyaY superfamily)